MGKFDGILICTDLDGTLFRNDKSISNENIAAIEYFKSEGGFFTFVTGRMPCFSLDVCDLIHPNAPFGCINGGGLYDHLSQEYIWTHKIDNRVLELVEYVDRLLPDVGIQVNTFDRVYFSKDNPTMEVFRQITHLPNLFCPYRDVKEDMAKIVFGIHIEERMLELERTLKAHPLADDFDFIRSERTLFEILPKGIGKGKSIEMLTRHLKLDRCKTIAIGDYNNDISMFHAAKIGIAVANACPEALAEADFVTVSNEEHAIAQVIRDLENGKYFI